MVLGGAVAIEEYTSILVVAMSLEGDLQHYVRVTPVVIDMASLLRVYTAGEAPELREVLFGDREGVWPTFASLVEALPEELRGDGVDAAPGALAIAVPVPAWEEEELAKEAAFETTGASDGLFPGSFQLRCQLYLVFPLHRVQVEAGAT
ncbi:MAG: hypothetical protein GY772_23855 [bacterium]|nr:hypothetical protein [bacterium]